MATIPLMPSPFSAKKSSNAFACDSVLGNPSKINPFASGFFSTSAFKHINRYLIWH